MNPIFARSLSRGEQMNSDTIQPLFFFYKTGVEYIKGISIVKKSSVSIRIDRIQNIIFQC